jgi:hypothetical protein
MGYYVSIESCNSPNDVLIKKENFVEAYTNLCWLNTNPEFDVMKSGGSYSGEGDARHKRPDGLDYHPNKWFSWVAADYHLKLKTLQEVLNEVGFDINEDEKGISALWYNNKSGNEDIFLCALAPFIEDGSEIVWVGEDNEKWKHSFKYGKMYFHKSKVLYSKEGKWVSLLAHKKEAEAQDKFFAELTAKMNKESSK